MSQDLERAQRIWGAPAGKVENCGLCPHFSTILCAGTECAVIDALYRLTAQP